MTNHLVSASILSADFTRLAEQIRACEDAGVDWIHIDVMDGHFVPNITMGPFIVETVRKLTSLPLDVHLMTEKPERHIDSFASAGADYLTIHAEGNPNIHRTLQAIKTLGVKPALALNPGTPIEVAEPLFSLVDFVLIMAVNPGYSGQKFIPETYERVSRLSNLIDLFNKSVDIQIDGGVNGETGAELVRRGATILVAATAIFKHPQGIAAGVAALK